MQQIGRYQILGELGRGAMGIVYGAMDPAIGRHVAIKTIRLSDITDEKERARLRERLLREAQSAGKLFHPGIVVVLDVGQHGDLTYIAMEFVNGPSLERLLSEDEPLSADRILDILRQTAAALDYAHKKGIVHRDIKPANILIHEDGVVKITDFGVAKVSTAQGMTQTGTVLGTPNYMSPEQIQGKPVDGQSDQFSLGVIAYEMLTGEKPFAAEQMTTVLYKIVGEEPPSAQALNPSVGWPASVVLAKALAKDPATRFPDCCEFVKALETALRSKRDWKPISRGASQSLPTSVVAPLQTPMAPGTTLKPIPARRSREPEEKKRGLGWGVLFAALAGFAIVGLIFVVAREWFGPAGDGPQAVQSQAEEPASPSTKPSAMGAPVAGTPSPQEGATGTQPAQQPPAPVPQADAAVPPGGEQAAEQPKAEPPKTEPVPAKQEPTPAAAATPAVKKPAVRDESAVPPGGAEAAAPQTVQITTNPPGARVVFDNNPARTCTSPCSVTLSSGRHTMVAALDGHRTEMRIFQVSGQPRELFINLSSSVGRVLVKSDPPGARIVLNNQLRNETTPAELTLPAGHYTIAVLRNGSRSEQEFDLKEGAAVRIDFPLN